MAMIGRCVVFAFDEGAYFSEFVFAGGFHGESVESELRGGPGEETLAEVLEDFALHGILAERGAINMSAIGFVADDESLGGHDLEHLEDGGVTGGAIFIEGVVNFADGGRLLLPEDLKQLKFGFGRARDGGAVFHDG